MSKIICVVVLLLAVTYCKSDAIILCPEGRADSVRGSGKCDMPLPDIKCFNNAIPQYCSNSTVCQSCDGQSIPCSHMWSFNVFHSIKKIFAKVQTCQCSCGKVDCDGGSHLLLEERLAKDCAKFSPPSRINYLASGDGADFDDESDYDYSSDDLYGDDYDEIGNQRDWDEVEKEEEDEFYDWMDVTVLPDDEEKHVNTKKDIISLCPMFGLRESSSTKLSLSLYSIANWMFVIAIVRMM